METILKRLAALIVLFDMYILYKVYNALNESYLVILKFTV